MVGLPLMMSGNEFHAVTALYENDLGTMVLFDVVGILELFWQTLVLSLWTPVVLGKNDPRYSGVFWEKTLQYLKNSIVSLYSQHS